MDCLRSPLPNISGRFCKGRRRRVLALFDGWEEWGGHGRVVCAAIPPLALFATDAPEDEAVYAAGAAAPAVGADRIEWVVRFNHIMTGRHPIRQRYRFDQAPEAQRQGMGLWGVGSFLNHSAAAPNADCEFVCGGRVMVLRAARDLAADEEVLIDYHEEEDAAGTAAAPAPAPAARGGGGSGGGRRRRLPNRDEMLRGKGVVCDACKGLKPPKAR